MFGIAQQESANQLRPRKLFSHTTRYEILLFLAFSWISPSLLAQNYTSNDDFTLNSNASFNPGSGIFANSGQALGNSDSRRAEFGDLDNDGDLDAFVANRSGQPDQVMFNNGQGVFSIGTQALGNRSGWDVALGDIDADGDLDAVVAHDANQQNQVWLNNGSGVFSDHGSFGLAGSSNSVAVELGDVDADGDLDAIVGNWNQPNRVWLNNGSGVFTDTGQALGNVVNPDVALADIDSDGDLDILFATFNQDTEVWLNDGTGLFLAGTGFGSNEANFNIDLGDLDADGDVDIYVANFNEPNSVWLNDGSGTFSLGWQTPDSSHSYGAALGDIDGDGDLDIVDSNWTGQPNRVWTNNGSAVFTDNGQRLGNSNSSGVALGDIDSDGDLDAMFANDSGQPNTVWINSDTPDSDGDGLPDAVETYLELDPLIPDTDNDGVSDGDEDTDGDTFSNLQEFQLGTDPGDPSDFPLQDTVVSVQPSNGSISALLNTNVSSVLPASESAGLSTGTFVLHATQSDQRSGWSVLGSGTSSISLLTTVPFKPGELVGSTITQGIVMGSRPLLPHVWQFRIAVDAGSGIFANSGQALGNSDSRRAEFGDLDNDGDLDAFVANRSGQPDQVMFNNGQGVFSIGTQALGNRSGWDVALGDIDADGDLDAVVAHDANQQNQVWLNNGSGVFSDHGSFGLAGSSNSVAVELGDVDADGDLDAIVGNWNQPNRVWLNNGSGVFTDTGQALGNVVNPDVALADIDSDGDLDILFATFNQDTEVWLNDGTGLFLAGTGFGSNEANFNIDLGDLDADGDVDIYVANFNEPNSVWLNDGSGTFSLGWQTPDSSHSYGAALGDIDGDGDLDIVDSNWTGQPNRVWTNNGSAEFTDNGQRLGNSNSSGVALGDIDGDGDLDAMFANDSGQQNTVWLNTENTTPVDSECPATMNLGNLGSGVAAMDTATGTGWLMWSGTNVKSRFSPSPNPSNADRIVAVKYESGQWYFDNNARLTAFTPESDDCLLAAIDFDNDTVMSLQGTDNVINGIDSGYATGDLVVTANRWNGVPNSGEFGLQGTVVGDDVMSSGTTCPATMTLGDLGRGVAAMDAAVGTGWMMWSSTNVKSRFSPSPNPGNADHIVAVKYESGQWYVDNNARLTAFTPDSDDCLLASVNFDNDTVTSLQGTESVINGIDSGYATGDLVVTANIWNGVPNAGEFGLEGTVVGDDVQSSHTTCPASMSLGDLGLGVAAMDAATGTGWLMWSSTIVQSRFSPSPNASSAKQLLAVKYQSGQWFYDNNARLTAFTPASDDCLLASIDFDNDTVMSLQGTDNVINGIDSGYVTGDLVVTPNVWNGVPNSGEFGLEGSMVGD